MDGEDPVPNHRAAKGKGKGKEKEEATPTSLRPASSHEATEPEQTSSSSSFMSRVASSTTHLAQNLVTSRPAEGEMASIVPSNKGETSTVAQDKNGSSAADIANWRSNPSIARPEAGFRSSQTSDKGKSSEADFSAFLEHEGRVEQAEAGGFGSPLPQQGLFEVRQQQPQQQSRDEKGWNAVGRAEDGSEVVDLLNSGYDDALEVDLDARLSAEEQAALRRALFPDDRQGKQNPAMERWGDLLDFTPGFLTQDRAGDIDMVNHLGTSEPEEARAIWVSHWQDVLSSYTDEVWGNLNALVGEAREELRVISESGEKEAGSHESGALRRLQQILSHIRGF